MIFFMKDIHRIIENQLLENIGKNKVLLLYGTRRVGKTFLVQSLIRKMPIPPLFMNGEDFEVQEIFRRRSITQFNGIIGEQRLLVIDEAQAIPEAGKVLKLLIDTHPQLTIIATGSSSLDLAGTAGEPLTGRHIPFLLYPIAQKELRQNRLEAIQQLEDQLIYGSYPEIFHFSRNEEKAAYLHQLIQSYLLKDILVYSGIRHSDKIFSLLRLIAFQTGAEVSYQELSNKLGISKITVEHYLDLLSKVFILFKLPAYSTNRRNEISKGAKWYFYDNGIRNAVVNDFRLPSLRNDMGALWESYCISERIKKKTYEQSHAQFYFWRTYRQQQIDLIEHENGILRGYEIKYSSTKRNKVPSGFSNTYPEAVMEWITRDSYLDFIE